MNFPSNPLRLWSQLIAVLWALMLALSIYVFPESFALMISYFGTFISGLVLVFLFFTHMNLHSEYERRLANFLGINADEAFTYDRIVSCVSELLVWSAVISIAYVGARQLDGGDYSNLKIGIAILITIVSCIGLALCILRFSLNCFRSNILWLVTTSAILFFCAGQTVTLGLATGKGLVEYYNEKAEEKLPGEKCRCISSDS